MNETQVQLIGYIIATIESEVKKMKVTIEVSHTDYDFFWSGGRDTIEDLTSEEVKIIFDYLEEAYPDGMTEYELNNFFWFERDFIAELLGYNSYDEILSR